MRCVVRSVRVSKFSPHSSHIHTYPTSGVLLLDSIFISVLPGALLDLSGVRVVGTDYVETKELIHQFSITHFRLTTVGVVPTGVVPELTV